MTGMRFSGNRVARECSIGGPGVEGLGRCRTDPRGNPVATGRSWDQEEMMATRPGQRDSRENGSARQRGNWVARGLGQQDPLLWQPGCQRSADACAEEGTQCGCRSDSRPILGVGRAAWQPGCHGCSTASIRVWQPGCQSVILGCTQYGSQGCGNPVAKNIGGWQ